MTGAEHGLEMRAISPELCLVDPELAAWCRLRLREEAAAAEARRSERAGRSATAITRIDPAPPRLEPATRGASWPRLVGRQSVIAIASALLLGVSGAASRPAVSAMPLTTPIVSTWSPIAPGLSPAATASGASSGAIARFDPHAITPLHVEPSFVNLTKIVVRTFSRLTPR